MIARFGLAAVIGAIVASMMLTGCPKPGTAPRGSRRGLAPAYQAR